MNRNNVTLLNAAFFVADTGTAQLVVKKFVCARICWWIWANDIIWHARWVWSSWNYSGNKIHSPTNHFKTFLYKDIKNYMVQNFRNFAYRTISTNANDGNNRVDHRHPWIEHSNYQRKIGEWCCSDQVCKFDVQTWCICEEQR